MSVFTLYFRSWSSLPQKPISPQRFGSRALNLLLSVVKKSVAFEPNLLPNLIALSKSLVYNAKKETGSSGSESHCTHSTAVKLKIVMHDFGDVQSVLNWQWARMVSCISNNSAPLKSHNKPAGCWCDHKSNPLPRIYVGNVCFWKPCISWTLLVIYLRPSRLTSGFSAWLTWIEIKWLYLVVHVDWAGWFKLWW